MIALSKLKEAQLSQRWLGVVVGALVCGISSGAARADRMAQANSLFSTACARCHSADKLRPKTSAQGIVQRKSALEAPLTRAAKPVDPVRTWIEKPIAVDPDTLCEAGRMDPGQRDLLVSFLRRPTNPMLRAATVARVAPLHHGITEAAQPPGPKLGQGDHR